MSFRAIAYAALVVVLLASPARRGASTQPMAQPDRLTSYVNPFIGTGGHGHTYPGPSLPFGMIQPGPDTRLTGWDCCSGYHYSDTRIVGFSHTHLSGTGIPDYGDVLLMPTTGEARLSNGADGTPGYSSSFSHATEEAAPGYYAVTLNDYAHPRGADDDTARGLAPLHVSGRAAGARGARPRASRPGARLVDRRRRRPRGDGPSPIAELGAGPAAVLRDPILAALPVLSAGATRRSTGPSFDFGDDGGHAARESRHLGGQHRRRAPEPRRRAARLGLRRGAPGGRRARGSASWRRSASRAARATSASSSTRRSTTRCSRPTSTWTSTGSIAAATRQVHQRRRLHVLLGVLALGHVSRAASAAHAHRPRAHRGFRADVAAAVPGGRAAAGVGARRPTRPTR